MNNRNNHNSSQFNSQFSPSSPGFSASNTGTGSPNQNSSQNSRLKYSVSMDELHTLQEIITEALLMTGSAATAGEGAANSNGYISGSFTDQAPSGTSDLSLGRMFLFYKNLEGRVSRLEGKVYGNQVAGRVGAGVVEKDGEYNTINPAMISSSSGTLLRSRNSSVASSSSDFSMLISPTITDAKELRRCDLDAFCLPLLQVNPKPENAELQSLARHLEQLYPQFRYKDLLSKIREWFRKRREYMSQRIFHVCEQEFPASMLTSDEQLRDCIAMITAENSATLEKILKDAQLEILDEQAALAYCREKAIAHLTNAYKEYVRVRTSML